MGIFSRFITMLKSWLNALIGKAEDPEHMLNQMMIDMQEQLIQAKKQVAISIADEKRLSQQFEQERQLSEEWEKRAMLAVKAGNDELAKQALDRKAEHSKQAQGFYEQWNLQKNSVEKLKVALTQLTEKINEAKRKKNLLIARAKRAEAQKTISETMSGISQTSAIDTISRMEEKIDRMEAEAVATTELAKEIETDELEAKFKKLDVVAADDALADLKAKMGISAPAPALTTEHTKAQSDALKEIEKELAAEVSAKRS